MRTTFVKKEEEEPLILSTKEGNRHRLSKIIKKFGPQRFSELEKKSGKSPRGLNNMLKDMLNDKKIHKVIHNGHQAYDLTEVGNTSLTNLDYILRGKRNMIVDGGALYTNYSTVEPSIMFCHLPWGIDDELVLDKNISDEINPITKDTAIAVQKFLFKKLLSDVKKKKIKLDKKRNGSITFELSVDYKELVKSLEMNSLKIYENITKEELDLYEKTDNMTSKKWEYDLLKEVRAEKITKEQFRRKLKRLQKQHAEIENKKN